MNDAGDAAHAIPDPKIWRVGTLNVQAGIATHKYRDYVTKSWQHVLPSKNHKEANLTSIISDVRHLDVFGVQELDSGSMRSGFCNQASWLAHRADFSHWSCQTNRVTHWSQTANAMLSRQKPVHVEHWRLPNSQHAPSSRGAVVAHFACPTSGQHWCAVVAHLSLSRRDRNNQALFLAERLKDEPRLILMGDFNAEPHALDMAAFQKVMDGHTQHATYPRWRPNRAIDIMWWKGVDVSSHQVNAWGATDHCGVELSFSLPSAPSVALRSPNE